MFGIVFAEIYSNIKSRERIISLIIYQFGGIHHFSRYSQPSPATPPHINLGGWAARF